ncbi:hypothetical protein BsWGS_25103 [Bradybaena similaris]
MTYEAPPVPVNTNMAINTICRIPLKVWTESFTVIKRSRVAICCFFFFFSNQFPMLSYLNREMGCPYVSIRQQEVISGSPLVSFSSLQFVEVSPQSAVSCVEPKDGGLL